MLERAVYDQKKEASHEPDATCGCEGTCHIEHLQADVVGWKVRERYRQHSDRPTSASINTTYSAIVNRGT